MVEDTQRAAVVRLYRNGAKLTEITTATGLSRGTIYAALKEAGEPLRRARPHVPDWRVMPADLAITIPTTELVRQLDQALNEIGRLQERNRLLASIACSVAEELPEESVRVRTIAFVHTIVDGGEEQYDVQWTSHASSRNGTNGPSTDVGQTDDIASTLGEGKGEVRAGS